MRSALLRSLRVRAPLRVSRSTTALSRRALSTAASPALSEHDRLVQKEFNMQAQAYAGKYTGDLQQTLGWIRDGLWHVLRPRATAPATAAAAPAAPLRVLDLSSGTGAFTRLLAPHVGHVTALDLTPGMIAQAQAAYARDLQQRGGQSNVTFVHANAMAMPFADASFDLVVSRFAVHHWSGDAAPQIFREIARVTKPGGHVAIVDIVTPFCYRHGPHHRAVTDRLNALERARDPSHTRFQDLDALHRLMTDTNALRLWPATTVHDRLVDTTEWLATAQTPATEARAITQALEREIAAGGDQATGDVVTGFRPFWRDASAPLPVTSSNVHAQSIALKGSADAGKRLSFWHTDVLVGATKF